MRDHHGAVARVRNLFPAGDYTNQSIGGTGIKSWVDKPDYVVDEDIVIWHFFGFNHIPRIEDFPIMPDEIAQMHLKPYDFCAHNPTSDMPPSTEAFNKSVLYDDLQRTLVSTNGCPGPPDGALAGNCSNSTAS